MGIEDFRVRASAMTSHVRPAAPFLAAASLLAFFGVLAVVAIGRSEPVRAEASASLVSDDPASAVHLLSEEVRRVGGSVQSVSFRSGLLRSEAEMHGVVPREESAGLAASLSAGGFGDARSVRLRLPGSEQEVTLAARLSMLDSEVSAARAELFSSLDPEGSDDNVVASAGRLAELVAERREVRREMLSRAVDDAPLMVVVEVRSPMSSRALILAGGLVALVALAVSYVVPLRSARPSLAPPPDL